MKGNDGKGKMSRRMEQMKLIIPTVLLLLVLLLVVKVVLKTDESDIRGWGGADGVEEEWFRATKSPRREGTGGTWSSNFCSEFAVNEMVDDALGGSPRVAIFHHTTTANKFSADTPSHTTLNGVVSSGEYEYFQVCVAQHNHHHKVSLELKRVPTDLTARLSHKKYDSREIDLYISADYKKPRLDHGSTWISRDTGDDSITIPTYVSDFEISNSHTLYVGVHNREESKAQPDVPFTLEVKIVDVNEREVLKRGSLRGGKRIMPGQAPDLNDVRRNGGGRGNGYAV
ncbi:hypothetical protein TrVE_jg10269 [Triparma verrucosa]|uniref:Uncharacterized protein n=1 Tax=Triparma verrucosa TaxID=1606542 RepID=A0A9W7C726_9STRA|nr:hypothetical protein TrVE_jg10269 [Triparma verrucosa]